MYGALAFTSSASDRETVREVLCEDMLDTDNGSGEIFIFNVVLQTVIYFKTDIPSVVAVNILNVPVPALFTAAT